jgi:hypothetical protein
MYFFATAQKSYQKTPPLLIPILDFVGFAKQNLTNL